MRTQLRPLLLALVALAAQPFISAAPRASSAPAHTANIAVPPAFARNTGQANPLARFISVGGGQPIFFTTNDVRIADPHRHRSIWMTFVDGAARDIDGEWSTGGHFTVLRRADKIADEPLYRDVVYRDVWRGIDARVSAAEKGLKYSFEVAPGGDPRAIHVRYSGADRIELTDTGQIVLDAGGTTIIDTKPIAYQLINGRKVSVPVRFVQFDSDVAFSVGSYDRTKPLVIDPTLVYSTYIGSSATDTGHAVAVDSTGAAYVVGSTAYGDLPVTAGAYQTTWHGDPNTVIPDAFVAKVNAAGTRYDYLTYLGGNDQDVATGVAVDASGNAYVVGNTRSIDFPTTASTFASACSGTDGFLTKLNSTGTALVYSTCFAANSATLVNGVAIDGNGNAYVVGGTYANNFPVSLSTGALPAAHVNGLFDGFLLKFNASGTQVLYGTYIGGTQWDIAKSVAVDSSGRAYIAGTTSSASGVGFGTPFQPYPNGPFFTSTDGGQTFTNVSTGGSSAVNSFAIDPVNTQTAYAATSDRGLLKTTDGGAHWAAAGLGPSIFIYSVAINPVNTGTALASTSVGLFRTTDGFSTVTRVFAGTPSGVAFAPSSGSIAYASWSNSVLKSTDAGATWTSLLSPDSQSYHSIAVDPTNASTIFVGGDSEILRSTDGGATWYRAPLGSSSGNYDPVYSIAIDPTYSLDGYAVTSSGRLYSTFSGGTSWSIGPHPAIQRANQVVFDGHTAYVASGDDPGNASLAKTSDSGSTWTRMFVGGSTTPVLAFAASNGVLYAGTAVHSDAFLWKVDTNATTSSIVYGTYIGGVLNDSAAGVALDPAGNPVVAVSTTTAQTFPTTSSGPSAPAAVLRFSSTGGLVTSTFAMTSDARNVDPRAIAVDRNGNAYLAAAVGVGSPTVDDGVWIGQMNAAGNVIAEYTLNGSHSGVGSASDQPAGIAAGPTAGDVYVTGTTSSTDFPTTAGAPQPNYASGASDAFLSKVAFGSSTTPPPPPPPPSGTNLALNKPAKASSSYSSQYTPNLAVDGSTTTRWSSQFSDPQWFEVDLQASYNISEVILRWETAYGADYTVQVSSDDANWTTIKTVTSSDGGVDDLTGLSGTGRYVRVNGTRRATQWGYSLWEFEVYGTAASPPPPPPPPPPTTSDLALNRPVVSSSDFSSQYAAQFAVDGNSSTRWSSQFSDPQWIYVDLGQRYKLSRVRLTWETARASDFEIQVSDDAVHWLTASTTSGASSSSLIDDIPEDLTGRYVRMYGTRRATQWGYSLYSFEVYGDPSPDTVDRALNQPVTSSSDYSSAYAASFAVDGNASTRWSSQFSDPQWIAVDLGAVFAINEVKLTWEAAYGADYLVQVSMDGVNWSTAVTVTGGDGGVDDLALAHAARYVRVYGTRRGTPYGYSLWSFQVYGAATFTSGG